VRNASSEESFGWVAPSVSVTRSPVTGCRRAAPRRGRPGSRPRPPGRTPAAPARRRPRAELEAEALERLDVEHDVRELAGAAVLLDVPVHQPGHPAHDRLPVGHPGRPTLTSTRGLADLLHRDLQVQFAHAGQHRLAGLGSVRTTSDGSSSTSRASADASRSVSVLLRLDRHGDHRVGDRGRRFEDERGVRVRTGSRRRGRTSARPPRRCRRRPPGPARCAGRPAPAGSARSARCAARPGPTPCLPSRSCPSTPQVGQPPGGGRVHLEHQRGERRRRVGRPLLLGRRPHRSPHRRHVHGDGRYATTASSSGSMPRLR
jgi:hypothetical protein